MKRKIFIGRPGTGYTNFPRHGAALPQTPDQARQLSQQQAASIRGTELVVPGQTDVPAAAGIQEGEPISRLPDVAFQPENSLFLNIPVDPLLCAVGGLFTTWAPILSFNVPDQRKFIIKDMNIVLSNPRLVSIAEAQILVDSKFEADVPIQKPCWCPLGFTLIINGISTVQVRIRTTGPTDRACYIDGSFQGWNVPDALPRDRKYDK